MTDQGASHHVSVDAALLASGKFILRLLGARLAMGLRTPKLDF